VEHADQGRPDLRREPDALPFARRERLRAAIEREVVEPDVDEEPEARRDRLQQRFRDGALARAEEGRAGPALPVTMGGAIARGGTERLDEAPDVPERHRPDLRHVLAAELHREGFGAEALAFAGVARARHEEAPELFGGDSALARVGVFFVGRFDAHVAHGREALLEPRHEPEVRRLLGALAPPAPDLGLRFGSGLGPRCAGTKAVEDRLALRLGQLDPGGVGVDAERLDGGRELGRQRHAGAAPPREHDAFAQRLPRVADAALGIDDVARAEPVARGARAVGAVEREHARLDGRQRDAAVDAGEALAHPEGLFVARLHEQAPFTQLERELDAVGEAPFDAVLQDEAIDHDVEVVDLRAIELDLVAEVDHRAVDSRAHEALATQALELELELALPGPRDGRHDREARPLGHREDPVDDLLNGLRLDALSAVWTMRNTDARIEEPQVVGDLGDRAHRRARGLREGPLLDGDRGAEPVDALDVGLRELLEELPRVRAQGLDVASLALGVDRIEGERRLTRTAGAGEDDDLASRQAYTDVL